MGSDSAAAAITIWWSCDAARVYPPMPRSAWASNHVDLLMPLATTLLVNGISRSCLEVHWILILSHKIMGKLCHALCCRTAPSCTQACPSKCRCGHAQSCKVLCCCICPFLG